MVREGSRQEGSGQVDVGEERVAAAAEGALWPSQGRIPGQGLVQTYTVPGIFPQHLLGILL